MTALADGGLSTLIDLRILYEISWFKGRYECIVPLLRLLSKQKQLKDLSMRGNSLTKEQVKLIKRTLLHSSCQNVDVDVDDKFEAMFEEYRDDQ